MRNLTGQKFGKLLALYYIPETKHRPKWMFHCDCGNPTIKEGSAVLNGYTTSCGCVRKDVFEKIRKKLPFEKRPIKIKVVKEKKVKVKIKAVKPKRVRKPVLPPIPKPISLRCLHMKEYQAWKDMVRRCYSTSCKNYNGYGGRGITVCEEWRNGFSSFFNDLGERPSSKHSLERIENDKGYYKENCKWATKEEQMKNRRCTVFLEHNGVIKSQKEWANYFEISYKHFNEAIRRYKTIEAVILTYSNIQSKFKLEISI